MTSRREDSAVRGIVYALIPALAAWAFLAAVLVALATLLPVWALGVLAVGAVVLGFTLWAIHEK
jgi:hypothetical protein